MPVAARVLAHVVVQPLVQRDERARGLGHDRRLDGDRRSIPVAVRVHRGDRRARTLLPELPPAIALGVFELALGPPPPVLGAVGEVLSRLGALHSGVEHRLLHLAFSSFLCLVVVVVVVQQSLYGGVALSFLFYRAVSQALAVVVGAPKSRALTA